MSGYGEAIEISNNMTFHLYFPDPILMFFHKQHKTQKGFWKQNLSFYGETNADVQMDTRAGLCRTNSIELE